MIPRLIDQSPHYDCCWVWATPRKNSWLHVIYFHAYKWIQSFSSPVFLSSKKKKKILKASKSLCSTSKPSIQPGSVYLKSLRSCIQTLRHRCTSQTQTWLTGAGGWGATSFGMGPAKAGLLMVMTLCTQISRWLMLKMLLNTFNF